MFLQTLQIKNHLYEILILYVDLLGSFLDNLFWVFVIKRLLFLLAVKMIWKYWIVFRCFHIIRTIKILRDCILNSRVENQENWLLLVLKFEIGFLLLLLWHRNNLIWFLMQIILYEFQDHRQILSWLTNSLLVLTVNHIDNGSSFIHEFKLISLHRAAQLTNTVVVPKDL